MSFPCVCFNVALLASQICSTAILARDHGAKGDDPVILVVVASVVGSVASVMYFCFRVSNEDKPTALKKMAFTK